MLYADVIVRKSSVTETLTYTVPASILPYLRVGSLVKVPLRQQNVRAIVVALRKGLPHNLTITREIISVEGKASFSPAQIRLTSALAKRHGAALAETARFSLRHPADESAQLANSKPKSAAVIFISGDWKTRQAAYKNIISGKNSTSRALVILPSWHLVELFFSGLPPSLRSSASMVKKELSAKREGSSSRIFVGTIGQIFLPLAANDILILDSPDHIGCRFQQRPYLVGREIALARSRWEKVRVCFGQTLPQAELFRGAYRFYDLTRPCPLRIVTEKCHELDPILLDELSANVRRGESTLIIVGQGDWGGVGYCPRCRQVVRCSSCGRPLSLEGGKLRCRWCRVDKEYSYCPKCKGIVHELGWGVGRLANQLSKQLKTPVRPWTSSYPTMGQEKIIVATEKALAYPELAWDEVVIWPDYWLLGSDFNNHWRLMSIVLQLSSQAGRITVRTSSPDHPIWTSLAKGECHKFLRGELSERRQLRLPPYGQIFSLRKASSRPVPQKEQDEISQLVKKQLPGALITRTNDSELEVYVARKGTSFFEDFRRALPPAWHIAIR